MTEPGGEGDLPPKLDPSAFVLRVPQPKAVRFRRGLIISLVGLSSTALIGVTIFALRSHAPSPIGMANDTILLAHPADTVARAPSSYAEIKPPAGLRADGPSTPPLSNPGVAPPPLSSAPADLAAVQQRAQAEQRAARSSPILVSRAAAGTGGVGEAPVAGANLVSASEERSAVSGGAEEGSDPNEQRHKSDLAFRANDDAGLSPHRLEDAASPWMLSAGTVIAASLVTGLNSDLPGEVIAQVTETVYDSATGRTVLIPQGTRLVGKSDSTLSYGQKRALVVWQRIVLPDGSSIAIDNLPATDASGYTGVSDTLDTHSWALIKGVMVSTLLGIGSELSFGHSDNDLARALRESTQANADRAGQQITSKNLDIQPTIRVRPGWPIRVLVRQDLVLRPWRSGS